ncbi:MAG TPA: ATP synthase F0 subunit A [Cryomorphaceae bacterium]|nr:ATP synthase F0 subunit A [Owenweeksia sp.]MBF97595.1 ATP synthase F0 subunit A [Owenweeksia sp.]HAD96543.1 ATP synthase F0 subunit A [Cryomorphaceae bacterium]HBF20658.1 ATP synthase F0 subunit A [Cryomorphaceae bacterium]|tara:strand:+ start:2295 stop:3362 length:1068 start_codon:yes stop_codon:yes gene_type:complete
MQIKKSLRIVAVLLFTAPFLATASDEHGEHGEKSLKETIKEDIQHHVKDSHDFHLFTDEESGTHVGFPLPVILWDDGLHVFMSSAFHHGEEVAESNGRYYALYHGKIYNTNAAGELEFDEHGHPENAKPLDFSITKGVASIIIISLIVFLIFRGTAKVYGKGQVPKGIAKFMEPLILFVKDEIAIPNIGEKHYKKYMSFLLTVFFFIWIANLVGLMPFGVNVTGNIAVTFALAILTFLITQFSGKKDYWKHIFWMPGVPVPMKFILAPIELLGVFIKPFALMIRLFANISAGHIVLMSLIGLLFLFQNWFARGAFLGLTLFLSIIELLVAFLQAYIFTMLSALYFGMAVEEHEHH